jgi:hypothetical protein
MNVKILVLVLLAGLLATSAKAQTKQVSTWPAKLDAVFAAPKNHKIVYEDAKLRVLQVICPPGAEEPVHTHRFKSMMWFTHSAHFIYYNYTTGANGRLIKKDSVAIKGFPHQALNKGQIVEPEGPHSIKNIGNDTFMAYRIEYKNN